MKFLKNKFLILLTVFVVTLNFVSPFGLMAETVDTDGTTTDTSSNVISIVGGVTNSGTYTQDVTYSSATETMTYAITVTHADENDTISINIPIGIDLETAPGFTENGSSSITTTDYLPSTEAIYFKEGAIWDNDDATSNPQGSVSTLSGTLTYTTNAVNNFTFYVVTSINTGYVPFTANATTETIGELTATLTSTDNTYSDAVDVFVNTQASDLQFTGLTLTQYVSTSDSAYSEKLATAYISDDGTYVMEAAIVTSMNAAIAAQTTNYRVQGFTFDVTVPKGTVLTASSSSKAAIGVYVDNDDGTWTYQVTPNGGANSSGTILSFSSQFIMDFENVEGSDVAGTQFAVTADNLVYTLSSFDYDTSKFSNITIGTTDTAYASGTTSYVTVSPTIDNSNYTTGYTNSSGYIETLNPYTDEKQTLYKTERTIGTYVDSLGVTVSAGTTETIMLEFDAIPDEEDGYLDNVTSIIMRIPFLGEEGMERYASQIESITIWYEDDDIGEYGITTEVGDVLDISEFIENMLDGTVAKSNSRSGYAVDSTGIVTYSYTTSATPYLTFTASEGQSIVKISVVISGDNAFYLSTGTDTSYVYGTPKEDSYTGEYSQYQFSTYIKDGNDWTLKAQSGIGGFRWEKPDPFKLTVTDTSLSYLSDFYYYNIAKYNTYIDLNVYTGNITPGYQNLGSIKISNNSGTPLEEDQYLVLEFDADETSSDVIKVLEFPVCPNVGENSIVSITYEYANGAKYTYSSDSGESAPYVYEDGVYKLYASGDNTIVKFTLTLSSWGTVQDSQTFAIYGYIDDTSNLARNDEHYFSYTVYDKDDKEVEDLGDSLQINSTFKHIDTTGADVRILNLNSTTVDSTTYSANTLVAGRSTEIQFELLGGQYNNVINGYWSDITFNIVLPTGITLNDVTGINFTYEKNGDEYYIPTDELIGNITITETEVSQEDAQIYFDDNTVTGATVYTCTLDDAEAILYGVRIGYEYNSFAKMVISATITPSVEFSSMLIPWSKVLLLGSNYDYSTFKKLLGTTAVSTSVSTGEQINNYADDFAVGVTSTIVTGSSSEYLFIDNVPELMVHNLTLTTDDTTYTYSESNEDSIAILYAGDSGVLSYSITNTITDEGALAKDNYVVISLPTSTTTSSSLASQSDFAVSISKIMVDNNLVYGESAAFTLLANLLSMEEDTSTTIEVKYFNSSDFSASTNTGIANLYNNGSDTYDSDSSYDLMVLKINDQEVFETINVDVYFDAPTHITTETEYIKIEAAAYYYANAQGTTTSFYSNTNAQSSIMFAYENPEWEVSFVAESVSSEGYITGTLDFDLDTIKVLHNMNVYSTTTTDSTGTQITAPEIQGYTFMGWYSNPGLTDEILIGEDGLTINEDTVLYAKYEANIVNVTYVFNNGTEDYTKTVDFDTIIHSPSDPVYYGYTFLGWYSDEACTQEVTQTTYGEIAGDASTITIYAGFSKDPTYTVTYNYDTDNFYDDTIYLSEEVVTVISGTPTKAGYTFAGWLYNGKIYKAEDILEMSHSNIVFEAQWTYNNYTIYYMDEDGFTKIMDSSSVKYTDVETILAPTYTKEGYTFAGWTYGILTYLPGSTLTMPHHDLTLIASWDVNSYTLSFDNVYVDELDEDYLTYDYNVYSTKLDYNATLTLPIPERVGYTFTGWVDEERETVGSTFTMGASNVTLSATWEVNSYTVTFTGSYDYIISNTNDLEYELTLSEETYTSLEINYGTIITLPVPTKEGYVFLHWEDDASVEYIAGNTYTIPDSNTNFTEVWKVDTYEVTFKDVEGTMYFDVDINYQAEMILPTPVKEGYKFNYWTYVDKEYSAGDTFKMEATSDITFIASWEVIEYTIEFMTDTVDNSSAFTTIKENYGTDVELTTTPEREGYTFKYWSDGINTYAYDETITMPADGLVLYPVWEVVDYTLTFDTDNSITTMTVSSQTLAYGTETKLAVIAETGYTFKGWTIDGDTTGTVYPGYSSFTVPASNVKFIAVWEINSYDVVFDYGYSDLTNTTLYNYGETFTFEELERTGYTFIGWLNDGKMYTEEDEFTLGTSKETFTAVWEVNHYTLSFEDTGNDSISDVTLDYDQMYTLSNPLKTGYTFEGWYDEEIEETYSAYEIFTMGISNVTLSGQWKANEQEIIFDYGYEGIQIVEKLAYESTITFKELTRVGYTFDGWLYDKEVYTSLDEITVINDSMTFVAQWSAIEYTITFSETGDSEVEDVILTYGDTYTLPIVTKDGYTFIAWEDANTTLYAAEEVITMAANNMELMAVWSLNEVEEDVVVDTDEDTDDTVLPDTVSPDTGDTTSTIIYYLSMILSASIIVFMNKKRRQN